jgi:3-oxoadipate enol-lactonase
MISKLFRLKGKSGSLVVHANGSESGPPVFLAHSILASYEMWVLQARLLAEYGFYVLRLDTRGHGNSEPVNELTTMGDLVEDTIAVLDQLDLDAVHYIGLSLGGMIGFGLGIQYPHRLKSLMLCAARADAPPTFVAPWAERISQAQQLGCGGLAEATALRWFGADYLTSNPLVAKFIYRMISATSVQGFVGCAQAICSLDYLSQVSEIDLPTSLVAGANDGPIPEAMQEIQRRIRGAKIHIISNAGHLPNIDQTEVFNHTMLRHLAQFTNT